MIDITPQEQIYEEELSVSSAQSGEHLGFAACRLANKLGLEGKIVTDIVIIPEHYCYERHQHEICVRFKIQLNIKSATSCINRFWKRLKGDWWKPILNTRGGWVPYNKRTGYFMTRNRVPELFWYYDEAIAKCNELNR